MLSRNTNTVGTPSNITVRVTRCNCDTGFVLSVLSWFWWFLCTLSKGLCTFSWRVNERFLWICFQLSQFPHIRQQMFSYLLKWNWTKQKTDQKYQVYSDPDQVDRLIGAKAPLGRKKFRPQSAQFSDVVLSGCQHPKMPNFNTLKKVTHKIYLENSQLLSITAILSLSIPRSPLLSLYSLVQTFLIPVILSWPVQSLPTVPWMQSELCSNPILAQRQQHG